MIRVECFGGVVIRDDNGDKCNLRSRKHAGLLLYLAATPTTTHTREDLASLLWDGAAVRERHSLSQALYDIRTNVGQVLDLTTRTVSLRRASVDCEATSFEKAVEAGRHDVAATLYRGDFAPNLTNLGADGFDRWLDAEQARFKALASLALQNTCNNAEMRGDWDGMCLAALRLIRQNDLNEEAHATLMRGLWLKGDPASALLHAESFRSRKSVTQWAIVAALADQIKHSRTETEVLSIPRLPDPIVGRETEFRDLLGALRRPSNGGHVVLLSGTRGVGKSALLLELARCVETRGRRVRWTSPDWCSGVSVSSHHAGHDERNIYFMDQHSVRNDDIQRLAAWMTLNDALAFIVTNEESPHRALRCGTITVVHVAPLSVQDICRMLLHHWPSAAREALWQIAALSGGNPRLAFAIGRAWQTAPRRGCTDVLSMVEMLLSRHNDLTVTLQAWLAELTPEEVDLAALLAVVTDETATVLRGFLGERERGALLRLRRRGLVAPEAGRLRICYPIMKHALALRCEADGKADRLGRLADALAQGSMFERYAAALEYDRLGSTAVASALASGVAQDALVGGNPALAAAAGEIAFRTTVEARDRFEAGLLFAECAFARGSTAEARQVLRSLVDVAPNRAAKCTVAIRLGKAAVAEGAWEEAARQLETQRCAGNGLGEPVAEARGAVELAQLRLSLAVLKASPNQGALSSTLEARLAEARSMAGRFPLIWIDGVRSLFAYHLAAESVGDAQTTVARHGDTLAVLGDAGRTVLATCRAVLEMRAARLQTAEQILRQAVAKRSDMLDRFQGVALNNLAVALLESGQFKQAMACLDQTTRLDKEVGLPERDRVTAHMNRAQCAFFGGEPGATDRHCRIVRSIARRHALVTMEAQALGMSGLVALWGNRPAEAAANANQARALLPHLPPDSDNYLVDWFLSVWERGEGRSGAADGLTAAANRYEPVDRLAAAKLHFLAASLQEQESQDRSSLREAAQVLRTGGCGWFVRFIKRKGES